MSNLHKLLSDVESYFNGDMAYRDIIAPPGWVCVGVSRKSPKGVIYHQKDGGGRVRLNITLAYGVSVCDMQYAPLTSSGIDSIRNWVLSETTEVVDYGNE